MLVKLMNSKLERCEIMSTGEYLTVMRNGDLMIYTDSDTVPGAGFLKLTKTF